MLNAAPLGALVMVVMLCSCAQPPASRPAPCARAATLASNAAASTPAEPEALPETTVDIAVTFDDLPAHGPLLPNQTHAEVHDEIVRVLAARGVAQAYGFVNGAKVGKADGRGVLERWRGAGHALGNHTWAHSNIDDVGAEAFIAEIDRNDALLAEIVGDDAEERRERRVFRFPYLREGREPATLSKVRSHLTEQGYRLAEVTIDFGDWAYNPPFARCSEQGNDKAVEALRFDFVRRGVQVLRWSIAAADAVYGGAIPHVLLLHSGSFDAAALDDLLAAYEKAGARWITLHEALEHDAYREDVRVPSPWGGTLLERRIERDDPPHPPFHLQPIGLLEQLCR